jgi:hypothetical protein
LPSSFSSLSYSSFPISNPTCATLKAVLYILAQIIDAVTMYSRFFYIFCIF